MDLEYSTQEELFAIIKKIDAKFYERFNANILYLEELAEKNRWIYQAHGFYFGNQKKTGTRNLNLMIRVIPYIADNYRYHKELWRGVCLDSKSLVQRTCWFESH
jgi:hypothetical protein